MSRPAWTQPNRQFSIEEVADATRTVLKSYTHQGSAQNDQQLFAQAIVFQIMSQLINPSPKPKPRSTTFNNDQVDKIVQKILDAISKILGLSKSGQSQKSGGVIPTSVLDWIKLLLKVIIGIIKALSSLGHQERARQQLGQRGGQRLEQGKVPKRPDGQNNESFDKSVTDEQLEKMSTNVLNTLSKSTKSNPQPDSAADHNSAKSLGRELGQPLEKSGPGPVEGQKQHQEPRFQQGG